MGTLHPYLLYILIMQGATTGSQIIIKHNDSLNCVEISPIIYCWDRMNACD